jgi:hypothetical protein
MRDADTPRRGGEVLLLRSRTTDDGEIKLHQVWIEPLTAPQDAEAVEQLAGLFATAVRCNAEATARLRRVA